METYPGRSMGSRSTADWCMTAPPPNATGSALPVVRRDALTPDTEGLMDGLENPKFAAIPGGEISYLEAGDGPALVFLHGIGSAAGRGTTRSAAFSDRFRVVAWNAPGYAGSTSAELRPDAPATTRRVKWPSECSRDRPLPSGRPFARDVDGRAVRGRLWRDRLLSLTLCGAAGGTQVVARTAEGNAR